MTDLKTDEHFPNWKRRPNLLKQNKKFVQISIVCDCTHEEKINFEGFTQNGCYGNQPHAF